MKPGERARVCPECGKIVSGKYGHDATCNSLRDPGGKVRSLGPMAAASRRLVYGRGK